jgi:hypothetical protein
MLKQICMLTALALAFSGPAWAKGTKHHRAAKHKPAAVSTMKSDSTAIDKCLELRYAEKVNCLHRTRGTSAPQAYIGASDAAAASGMAAGSSSMPQ